MKKKILQTFLLGMFAVFSGSIFAQHEVSGIIKDDFGADLPGASVRIKGTNEGTITDLNGYYKISVPSSSSILIFSFVGMSPKEVTVGAQTEINVVLQAADQDIKEVVITALGISREEKSLGYSVGKVSGDDLTKVNHENVLDALSGKTSGVQISSTGGPGSSLSIIIRGATSLNSDNQPLFVIDGVPVFNSLNNLGDLVSESVVDYGNSISDINPADIESVSILKGPSAAALYGSRAGNGVVMITTKSGKKGKKGIGVYLSSGVTFDKPYRFLPQQTRFTSGAFGMGMYEEGFGMWFGPETDLGIEAEQWAYDGNKKPLVAYPNKTRDFLNTGVTYNNNVGVTGNYEKGSFRLSLADMYNVGVIPNTDLHKKTFSLSTNYKVTEDFNVSTNINILENGSDNRSAGGKSVTNVLYALDNIPPHMPLSAFAGNYWEDGQEDRQQRIFDPKFANPYFVANELLNSFQRNRIYGNMKLNWQIVPKLSLMGRISLDRYNEIRESKIPWSYPDIPYGAYGIQTFNNTEINADFLVSYEDTFGDIKLNLSGGGNSRDVSGNNIVNNTNRLVLPGLFTISNAEGGPTSYFNSTYEKVVYSLYGMATVSYKDMVYLDLTARNDWSSTLPEDNRSYFYPSASISVLINEMIEMPSSIDMIKLRGGVAQVGNDTGPYSLIPSLGTYDDWGNLKRIYVQDALLSEDLKPEIATSYELGADFTFFDNRLTISPTYYVVQNKNQILSITDMPASSGYSSKKINAGLVESRGWELGVLTTPVKKKNFVWDLNFTISRNRTKILELTDNMPYFTLYESGGVFARTKVGEYIGDLWGETYLKVEDENSEYYGYPHLIYNSEGATLQSAPEEDRVKIGNFNHDFLMGIQTSLSYKGFHLSANINWRQGGQFFSNTYRQRLNIGLVDGFFSGESYPEEYKDNLTDYIKAHPEEYFGYWLGGMTPELGGFEYPENSTGLYNAVARVFVPGSAAFIPGVAGYYDDDGNFILEFENLGDPATTRYMHSAFANDAVRDGRSDMYIFDASFVKLREIALTYDLPYSFISKLKIQKIAISIFAKNIMLWTANDKNIDPERAFAVSYDGFKQGLENYNILPWVGSLGFRLNLEL